MYFYLKAFKIRMSFVIYIVIFGVNSSGFFSGSSSFAVICCDFKMLYIGACGGGGGGAHHNRFYEWSSFGIHPRTSRGLILGLRRETCSVVLTLESVDEILWCDHSNETSSAVLLRGTIHFSIFYKTNFGIFLEF